MKAAASVMNKIQRRVHIGAPTLKHAKVGTGCFSQEGLIHQSDYFLMSRPVLWMGFIFGRTPCYVRSGWMRYSFKSVPFIYAVLLALGNWLCYLYYHQQIAKSWNKLLGASDSFSNVLFAFLIFTQPFITMVMVYSWFFEVPAIVKCYNSTAILENKLSHIFPASTRKPFTRNLVTFFIAFYLVSTLVVGYFLIVGRYRDSPMLVLLLFIVNFVINFSHSVLWSYNFYFIRDLAMKLNKHMLLCLQVGENCAFKLRTCRKIWISIWKQSQSYSHSIATTISFTLITNGTIFVIGCYGVIASLRNQDVLGILEMSPYVLITFANIACIFEMSYQATNRLGNAFLTTLIILDRDAVDRECINEVDKFVNTINHTRNAVITLKDYITMDRTLLISFLSYSVTYLIVLLQFQDKNVMKPTNSTSILPENNTDFNS